MRSLIRGAVAGAALVSAVAVVVPAGAQACSLAMLKAQPVAPAAGAQFVQTTSPVPFQVSFHRDNTGFSAAQYGIARLRSAALPPLGATMPAEVGTVVETGALTFDSATGALVAATNANGWANTPGEYAWQASATQTFPPAPVRTPAPDGTMVINSCDSLGGTSITFDGAWTHRFTVLGNPAVTAQAAKARDGRAKVSGRIAKAFPGKVRLTVACPGQRERTTFLPVTDGRWSRKVNAKRGCRIDAQVAARQGWIAAKASTRIT